jgi:hypothetical protein
MKVRERMLFAMGGTSTRVCSSLVLVPDLSRNKMLPRFLFSFRISLVLLVVRFPIYARLMLRIEKKMQQLYTLDSEEEWCHERVLFPRLLDKRERALIRGGGTYSVCWKQGDLWDPLGGVYQQPNKRRSYQGFSANLVTRLKVFVISRFGSENVSSTISIVRHIGNQCQDHLAFWINAWNRSRRSISTPPSSLSCCLQATVQCHQY